MAEINLLNRISPVKGFLRRTSRNSIDTQPEVDITYTSQNCQQTGIKKKTKRGKVDKKKVQIALSNNPEDESEPETFQCEYCLTPGHMSVIECEKCNKLGCPECIHLPPDVHKIPGKWRSLHWYCTTCEPVITMFCKSDSIHFDKTGKPDNISARVSRL